MMTKRSRKEMERALRQGRLAEVLQEGGLTEMRAADPTAYQPEISTAPPAGSAVRNVPTQMYDPSTGTTVTAMVAQGAGHRGGGGKNPISQLLSQAAQLEQHRAQNPASAAKAHRASAKRKYGW